MEAKEEDKEGGNTQLPDLNSIPPGETARTGHKTGFDPFKPGQVLLAKKHRASKKVRRLEQGLERDERCECCGLSTEAPTFELCCQLTEMHELGPGFPMYFLNVKYICGMILCGVILMAVPCIIISNLSVDEYEGSTTVGNFTFYIPEVSSEGMEAHQALNISFMIILLLSYHFWRRKLNKVEEEIDKLITTPSDYTVMVTGLPINTDEQELKQFFETHAQFGPEKTEVIKVNFAYKIKNYIEDTRREIEILQELKAIESYKETHSGELPQTTCCFCFKKKESDPEELGKELAQIKEKLLKFDQDTEAGVGQDLLIGTAFVTFAKQSDARMVEERFGKPTIQWVWDLVFKFLCGRCFQFRQSQVLFRGETPIHARIAPEPSDIFWENLEVSLKTRLWNVLKTYLVTLVALGASFGMVFGCSVLKENASGDGLVVQINSIWPAVMIIVINFILGRLIRYFSMFEKHHTYTDFNSSVAFKLTFSQFLNTAVIALIVHLDETTWFEDGDLVDDVIYIMLSNALVQPLIYLVSPTFCVKRVKMYSAQKKEGITQGEMNTIYEPPPIDMAQRNASLMKTFLLTVCYAALIPGGLLIACVGLVLQYWVEKLSLLRRHSRPSRLSGDLASTMILTIPWGVLIYAIMNYIFVSKLNEDSSGPAFVWMFCVLGYIFLPIELIFGCFKKIDSSIFEVLYPGDHYNNVALTFYDDYDRENPVTQKEGWKRLLELEQSTEGSQPGSNPLVELLKGEIQKPQNLGNVLRNYAVQRDSLAGVAKRQFGMPFFTQSSRPPPVPQAQPMAPQLNLIKQQLIGARPIYSTYAVPQYGPYMGHNQWYPGGVPYHSPQNPHHYQPHPQHYQVHTQHYQTPVQPTYQTPAQPTYQTPAQPTYQTPAQPSYQTHAQPSYQAPAQPYQTYQAPQQTHHHQPYQNPQQPFVNPQQAYQNPQQTVPHPQQGYQNPHQPHGSQVHPAHTGQFVQPQYQNQQWYPRQS